MNKIKEILIVSVFAAIVAAPAQFAAAAGDDWATKITISQPVQIGNLVLVPGSYVFRIADMLTPNVVEIYSVSTNHYYGMVAGISAYRDQASDKPIFVFKKEAKGSPEELLDWYYPGNNYGLEFLPGASAHAAG